MQETRPHKFRDNAELLMGNNEQSIKIFFLKKASRFVFLWLEFFSLKRIEGKTFSHSCFASNDSKALNRYWARKSFEMLNVFLYITIHLLHINLLVLPIDSGPV